jgi:ATP-binding cassette subfamily B multidrug efflux pump
MKNLFTLKKYFIRYKKKLIQGFIFIVLSDLTAVYVPIILKDSIDSLHKNATSELLLKYGLMIIGFSVVSGVFRFMIRQTIIVVSREIEYDLRGDFWAHIQKLPLRFFQNNSTGNIMAHATNDINAVRTFVGPAVMYTTDTVVTLILVLALMISLNLKLTIYSLLPLPFLSYAVYKVGKKIHQKFTIIQEKFAQLTTMAQENFSGIRIVKSYAREESEMKRYAFESKDFVKKNMNLVRTQALIMPILFLLTGMSIIIVIWAGGVKVIQNEITLGELTAFVVFLGFLIWPMIAFGWVTNIIQQGEASMKRLNKIFAEPYEIEDSADTDFSIKEINGDIEFKNVSFRYNPNLPYILKDINLKIPKNSTIAIMGYTGSGKTTFVNLIPRLYDCTSGKVLIDGVDSKRIPLNVLRTNIGLVQQESFLFSDTVMNNLTYGLREIDEKKALEAATIAQFDNDVQTFPQKYDTIVGERGITFSGGQKQRASLARAIAIDPKILILDDSFSAVDTHTEEEILKRIKEFMKERTTLIISHRISTVKDADHIIVLSEGKIAEQGTHDELVALGGIYSDLNQKQLLEKELEEIN